MFLIRVSIVIFSFISSISIAQDIAAVKQTASLLDAQLDKFNTLNPDEKLYIETNRDVYHVGENLWYSAFVVDYISLQLSNTSQSVFVEILNDKSDVVGRSKVPNKNGRATGDIILSDTLEAGIYQITAYTTLQKQIHDPSTFFRKYIRIEDKINGNVTFSTDFVNQQLVVSTKATQTGGSISDLTVQFGFFSDNGLVREGNFTTGKDGKAYLELGKEVKYISLKTRYLGINTFFHNVVEHSDNLKIDFYPANGTYVEGLPSMLNFSINKSSGLPISIQCDLIDSEDKILQTIKTDKNGLASMLISARKSNPLRLRVKYGEKIQYYDLPYPDEIGICYIERKIDNNIIFNLYANDDKIKNVFILGHVRGKVQFLSLINFKNEYTEVIDTSEIPEGLLNIYLLDEKGNLLGSSKRVIIGNQESLMNTVSRSSESIGRISLNKVEDTLQLSASVNKKEALLDQFGFGIRDYFLIMAESNLAKVGMDTENIDLLASHIKESRYNWFGLHSPNTNQPKDYTLGFDVFSGYAEYENGEPLSNKNLILYSQGNELKTWFGKTNDSGVFRFLEVDSPPESSLVISASNIKKNREVKFFIEEDKKELSYFFNPLIWQAANNRKSAINFDSIPDFTDAIVLKNVVKKAERYNEAVEERREKLDRIKTVKGEDLQLYGVGGRLGILSIIQQVTSIYSWNSSNGNVYIRPPQTFSAGGGVIFYLNNTRMGDNMFNLNFLDPTEIEEVLVYRPGPDAVQFPFAPDGVIQIITKKGFVPDDNIKSKHLQVLDPIYSKSRSYDLIELNPELDKKFAATKLWKEDLVTPDELKIYDFIMDKKEDYIIKINAISNSGEVYFDQQVINN